MTAAETPSGTIAATLVAAAGAFSPGQPCSHAASRSVRIAAVGAGVLCSFVAWVDLVRWVRLLPLYDPDPFWAVPRLTLGLFVWASTATAGGLAAAALLLGARRVGQRAEPVGLAFSTPALVALLAAVVGVGTLLRFVELDRRPAWLFVDDVSLLSPTLALDRSWRDFADSIRPVPFGVPKLFGTVGVVYLEAFRAVLSQFGTTVSGLRFLSALAGCLSLVTAAWLGRALLPRGGGTLAALVLAGLRWHLILSRWAWVMIVLAPVVDMATLLLLRARRRRIPLAFLSGAVAGLGAHVYLSAWIAAAALLGLALWPGEPELAVRARLRVGLMFLAGFALVAAPLFLLQKDRAAPYFARMEDHNALREIRYTRSLLPALSAAADGLQGPWITSDPTARHDLPGRSRLGWIVGIPVLAALAQALLSPRRELSGLFLMHAGAALAATVAGGQAGTPNGSRFGYLTTVTAVAAAAGVLLLLRLVSESRRRAAALAAIGLVAISGALGARDALLRWPERRETFDGFHGQDTLIGRSARRWDCYGTVALAPGLVHSAITFEAIRSYRLDPEMRIGETRGGHGTARAFRIAAPTASLASQERQVERITDPSGKTWAVVVGKSSSRAR